MRRALEFDVPECPDCGSRMRFVAAIAPYFIVLFCLPLGA